MFHVTSSRNRQSIEMSGLDSALMGAARGIAGSRQPEQQGVFVCESEEEAEWFIRMNNTGGPVDLWAVDGIDSTALVKSPEGYLYLPETVAPGRLTLVRTDIPPARRRRPPRLASPRGSPGTATGTRQAARVQV